MGKYSCLCTGGLSVLFGLSAVKNSQAQDGRLGHTVPYDKSALYRKKECALSTYSSQEKASESYPANIVSKNEETAEVTPYDQAQHKENST